MHAPPSQILLIVEILFSFISVNFAMVWLECFKISNFIHLLFLVYWKLWTLFEPAIQYLSSTLDISFHCYQGGSLLFLWVHCDCTATMPHVWISSVCLFVFSFLCLPPYPTPPHHTPTCVFQYAYFSLRNFLIFYCANIVFLLACPLSSCLYLFIFLNTYLELIIHYLCWLLKNP